MTLLIRDMMIENECHIFPSNERLLQAASKIVGVLIVDASTGLSVWQRRIYIERKRQQHRELIYTQRDKMNTTLHNI